MLEKHFKILWRKSIEKKISRTQKNIFFSCQTSDNNRFTLTDNFLSINGISLREISMVPARCDQVDTNSVLILTFEVHHCCFQYFFSLRGFKFFFLQPE